VILTTPAHADRIADKQREADQVLARIRDSNASLERIIQQYDGARLRLRETQGKIRYNTTRLHVARTNLKAARQELRSSLVTAYKSGKPDVLQAVLASGSLTHMLDQVELLRRANRYNADVLVRVRTYKVEVATRQRLLASEKQKRAAAVQEQARRRTQMRVQLHQQEAYYSSVKEDIRRLIRAKIEAERRAAEARARAAQAALLAARSAQASVSTGVGGVAAAATAAPASVSPDPASAGGATSADASGTSGATTYTAPPASGVGAQAAQIALGEQGVPYVYGGASPSGFDCSGLIVWAYGQLGISLPHYTGSLWGVGAPVSQSDLQPGDLVFFDGLGHAGIYIGNGAFVHAPHTGTVVQVASLSGYYAANYVGARRVTG
jgi:cell wall-associated NlpC family hydrolase